MKAIVVADQANGAGAVELTDRPEPQPAINDVVVRAHAAGFTGGELSWPSTRSDRAGRARAHSIRDGTLAEYVAVEARNLAPLPGDIDFTEGAALVMPGLTAWQGLFEHGRLRAGQRVLVLGAAGAVGSMAIQLALEAGACVIGAGRASARKTALDFGAQEFVELENDTLKDLGPVDLVFDVLGGEAVKRSASLIRPGGSLVTIAGPTEARPAHGLTIDFVVESDRAQLTEIVRRAREKRLRTNIGKVSPLADVVPVMDGTERVRGKTIARI